MDLGVNKMNSLDRVMLAISFEKTDRVTVDLHNFLVTCEYSGLPYNEVFTSGEKLRTHKSRCGKDLGHGMLLVENGTTQGTHHVMSLYSGMMPIHYTFRQLCLNSIVCL